MQENQVLSAQLKSGIAYHRFRPALPPKADIAPCENLGSPTEAPGPENFNILDQETRSI